jgi:hypothetical protein
MQEFEAHNINILEIFHQRIFTDLPAKGLVTDIECEARDRAQLDKLVAALRAKGYAVSQVELQLGRDLRGRRAAALMAGVGVANRTAPSSPGESRGIGRGLAHLRRSARGRRIRSR